MVESKRALRIAGLIEDCTDLESLSQEIGLSAAKVFLKAEITQSESLQCKHTITSNINTMLTKDVAPLMPKGRQKRTVASVWATTGDRIS